PLSTTVSTLSFLAFFFYGHAPAPTDIYTLSLHDALPIWSCAGAGASARRAGGGVQNTFGAGAVPATPRTPGVPHAAIRPAYAGSDRKSTRLNSSHSQISYAVFCLKKKKKTTKENKPTHQR